MKAILEYAIWAKELLQGYKTYLCIALSALTFLAQLMGWIPEELANTLYTALGFGGMVAFTAKVNRIAKDL